MWVDYERGTWKAFARQGYVVCDWCGEADSGMELMWVEIDERLVRTDFCSSFCKCMHDATMRGLEADDAAAREREHTEREIRERMARSLAASRVIDYTAVSDSGNTTLRIVTRRGSFFGAG